jgi:DNA-binding winged helix-turn-helix (wHTH) protein/serine/threonine protein kinase
MPKGLAGEEISGRLWRFANCEFNECSRELRLDGNLVELEPKPLEVLYQLLLHAGEVVTRDELLEAVWPGVQVVEGSLPTAVSKLRKALGDAAPIVITVPRIGYRLGVPVQSERLTIPAVPEAGLRPGDPVPGRDQWRLARRLAASVSSEVWLGEHPKTGESRVFKFAFDGIRLRGLKREVTLARFLRESVGERPEFVRVLEWNFDTPPFYLETQYSGQDLVEWSQSQGGLTSIPFETRLRILVDAAQAVAAAHEVGVLHKDLKPANILLAPSGDGGWQVKVADFGSGTLVETSRLDALGITDLGLTHAEDAEANLLTGTLMYVAPEVLAGQSPTALADVYAFGVMLYQMAAGDFRKPLSPGWEEDVQDPLIREDIAAAACGDPGKRLASMAVLVDRLLALDRRRVERDELELARQRALTAERRLAASRARRPWAVAAVFMLVLGLAVSLALYRRASQERDRANRQTEITEEINRFLAGDLLGRSNPFQSGRSDETLVEAVKQAAPGIDRQFRNAPEIGARLHHAIARALDNRSDFPDARRHYERAAALYRQAAGPMSESAMTVGLQSAAMEARTYENGSLPKARSLLAAEESRIAKIPQPDAGLSVWLATARGMIALIGNDAKVAAEQFEKAYETSRRLPDFDENARLTLKQRLAFASIRLGDGVRAERLSRELIDEFSRLSGPESPSVLRVRLNLAQAFMIQGKHREVIEETSRIYPLYVARLGETHELSMQVLTTRAQSAGSLGRWGDAIRDGLAIHKMAVSKQGPLSFFAIAALSDAALAQCRAGRYAEGERNARTALESSTKAFGPRAGLTGGVAYTAAVCSIGLGRLAEAAKLLREIDSQVVAQLAGFPDWYANVDLAQGEIAYRQGDYDAAREYIRSAAPVFSRADAEPYQKHALESLTAALNKRLERQ